MAEATEELIKVYLEQRGYLVTTSKKVDAKTSKHSPQGELDIIAVRLGKSDGKIPELPEKIIGEVKKYGAGYSCFKKLYQDLRKGGKEVAKESTAEKEQGGYKIINIEEYKEKILRELKKYGDEKFTFVLFVEKIQKKYEQETKDFLKKENITLVTHTDVISYLFENCKSDYNNHPILNTINIMKDIGFVK